MINAHYIILFCSLLCLLSIQSNVNARTLGHTSYTSIYKLKGGAITSSSKKQKSSVKQFKPHKPKKLTFIYMIKSFFISMIDPSYANVNNNGNVQISSSEKDSKSSSRAKGNGRKLGSA